jgi:RNA polymerase sigma-70 factor (ECF subfamily)
MKSNPLPKSASLVDTILHPVSVVAIDSSEKVNRISDANFTEIYNSYYKSIYKIVNRMISDSAEAEDATQLCFIKVSKSIADFDPARSQLYTWIARIAVNTSLDIIRSSHYKNRSSTLPLTVEEIDGGMLLAQHVNTDRIGLLELLTSLTEKERSIMELLYFKGYTQSEAAKHLEIPLGTIKSLSGTAIKKIRKLCANELTIK